MEQDNALPPPAVPPPALPPLETERLGLRAFTLDDAPFVVRLLNDAGYLRHIADRGVRTETQARAYLESRILRMYREHGVGPYLVLRQFDGEPLGLCGLFRRDQFEDADLGFALLETHRGQGYASEAAQAVLAHARDGLGMTRLIAVTSHDNTASMRLLDRLGFAFEAVVPWDEATTVRRYGLALG